MKKIILILFLLLMKNINGQWYYLNPKPQGNIIDKILFIDEKKGFLVCGNNLLTTVDGGHNWEIKTFEHFFGPMKIFFLDKEKGWLTISDNGKGSLYKTIDSGKNWGKLNIPEDIITNFEMITDIFFISEYVGYITTDAGKIYYTNDGGNYWLSQFSSKQRKSINSIYLLTENVGFAVGQTPLLVTNDGGKNWLIDSTMLGNNFGLEASKIHFVDSLFGYILSFNSIYITNDAGIKWKNYIVENEIYNSLKDDFIQNDVFFLNTEIGWIATSFGLYKTLNGGKNWDCVDSSSYYKSIFFFNENTGFRNIKGGEFYKIENELSKTIDGGNTWIDITTKVTDAVLYAVDFINKNIGWAVGSFGEVIKSVDGGITWNRQDINSTNILNNKYYLQDVEFLNENYGWIVSNKGNIFKTNDGGKNWESQFQNDKYNFSEIFLLNENEIWIGGSEDSEEFGFISLLYHSNDAGITWNKVSLDKLGRVNGIHFFNSTEGCISVGDINLDKDGYILFTEDSGITWDTRYFNSELQVGQLQFINENIGYAILGNDFIYTDDRGNNWQKKIRNIQSSIIDFHFLNENVCWVVGILGELTYSQNKGESWEYISSPLNNFFIKDIDFYEIYGWVVGNFGMILKTDNGLITKIQEQQYFRNQEFELKIGNYPNPFNDQTKILYNLPEMEFNGFSNVNIALYNVLGEKVQEILDGYQQPGVYNLTFKNSNKSTGIYFLKISYFNLNKIIKVIILN